MGGRRLISGIQYFPYQHIVYRPILELPDTAPLCYCTKGFVIVSSDHLFFISIHKSIAPKLCAMHRCLQCQPVFSKLIHA